VNNEPAFPSWKEDGAFSYGMTLRDYFAAKAMQGILASWAKETCMYEEVSAISYEMADEMLKAREHGNS
jgi:hypothetical protein